MILAALAAAAAFQPMPCGLEGVAPDFEKQNRVECGWVAVPRDGRGKSIRLWTALIHATGPTKRDDPILYINGGPGIATVDSVLPAISGSATFNELRQDRDIILFDQRGSGRSEEELCPKLADALNVIAASGLSPAAEEDRNRAAFAACRAELAKSGAALESYTTASIVADVEALRPAFNVHKWNLLSVSYGGLVALHAMRANPQSLRAVILNSPYPPNSVTWAEQASSAAAAYQSINAACTAQVACRTRFGNVVDKLQSVIARLERTPLKDGSKVINGRQFATALWPLAVQSKTVRFIPLAIDRAYNGDIVFIRKLVSAFASGDAFGGYSPAQGIAISCHESGRTREWYARAQKLYPALVTPAPPDSWDRNCAAFRPGFADPAFFAPVASQIPVLIYAGTLDPAVPVVDAYQAMRLLTKATLIEVVGGSHAPLGIDECTRGVSHRFLANPDVPPDTSCVARRAVMPFATDGLDELLSGGP